MNYYQYPYRDYGDERQFFPDFLNPLYPGGQFPSGPGFSGQFPGVGPGGMPGFPNFGQFPGGWSGGQPGQFPGGGPESGPGAEQAGAPTSPPPPFTPERPQFQTFAVDPGAIRRCLFRFTYVWLRRESFWFYPTFVGRNSIAGFRWNRFRWVYFGINLNRIESFQCF